MLLSTMLKRIMKIIALSLLVTIIAALGLNYIVTKDAIHEAQEHVQDILLNNQGFHLYIQRVMHPAFFKGMADGLIAGDINGKKTIKKGEYVLVENDNVFVEAKWKEKEIIAYSKEGYSNKQWVMPGSWEGVKRGFI